MKRFIVTLLLSIAVTASAADIPRPSPDYSITMPDGRKISIGQYKGKVVALEFLLTTCPHCQKTSRALAALNKELGSKGFQPLGVAINDKPEIAEFIKENNVNYPVGVAPRETVYGYLQHSIMQPNLMMPQLVFIDKAGNIRAQYAGTDSFFANEDKNLRDMVEKLLKEGGASSSAASKSGKKGSS